MMDLCVWIVRGKKHLEAFSFRRESESDRLGTSAGDCFHDGKQPHPSLSAAVKEEMVTLLDDIRMSDQTTGLVLEIIRRMLRTEPKERPTAPEVLADMNNAIKVAQEYCNDWYTRRSRDRSASTTHGISAVEGIYPKNQADTLTLHSPVSTSTPAAPHFNFEGIECPEQPANTPFPDLRRMSDSDTREGGAAKDRISPGVRPEPHTLQSSPEAARLMLAPETHNEVDRAGHKPQSSSASGLDYGQNSNLLSVDNGARSIAKDRTSVAQPVRLSFDPDRRTGLRRQNVPYLSQLDAIKWRRSRKKMFGQRVRLDHDHYQKWLDQRDHVCIPV